MAKYTYIVNVDNAVDVSHFRMYFHESVSIKRLSLYSIDSLRDLAGKVDHITRHIDRNVFHSDENELIICVARTWGSATDINWWTLMIRARVYSACKAVIRRKVSKLRLIIVDNDNGALPEEKAFREEADIAMLKKGYIKYADPAHACISESWLKEISGEYPGADEGGRLRILDGIRALIPDNALVSDFIGETLKAFAGMSESHSFWDVYSEYFERNILDKIRDVDTCVIPVNGNDNAERRMVQLRLVTFLVDIAGRKLRENATVSEEFENYEFDPVIEAVRLKRYSEKINNEYHRLKKAREKARPEVKVSFSSMRPIDSLEEEDLIGNSKDAESILEKISGFRNHDNWEDEFLEIVNEISSYEDKLKEYGKTVNEEFHTKKKPEMLVLETVKYEDEKEALKSAEEEFRLANENSYKERGKGDSTYAALVEITNQLQVVGNCLRKLNSARKNKESKNFLRILMFAAAVIIIPFSIMQTYIFKGLLKGNILPAVCVAILLLAVILSKPFADVALNRSFKKEVRRLSELVRRYFEGIQQRQKLFHDNVECMAAIWNAEQKLNACREVVSSRNEQNMRMDYHRNALEEYAGIMGYFKSFIDNYYSDTTDKRIDDPVAQIDPKKDIADNGVYWIGNIVDVS